MDHYDLTTVVEILHVSVAPVVLISGVGLIILSQTNRMAHLLARIRQLVDRQKSQTHATGRQQAELLYKRARMIRTSITAFVTCIIFDALVIAEIFVSRVMNWTDGTIVTLSFGLSLLALLVGLITFLLDVNMNLRALKMEIDSINI